MRILKKVLWFLMSAVIGTVLLVGFFMLPNFLIDQIVRGSVLETVVVLITCVLLIGLGTFFGGILMDSRLNPLRGWFKGNDN